MRAFSKVTLFLVAYACLALSPVDASAAGKKVSYQALDSAISNCQGALDKLEIAAANFRQTQLDNLEKGLKRGKEETEAAGDPAFLLSRSEPTSMKTLIDNLKSKHTDAHKKCVQLQKMLNIGAKKGVSIAR